MKSHISHANVNIINSTQETVCLSECILNAGQKMSFLLYHGSREWKNFQTSFLKHPLPYHWPLNHGQFDSNEMLLLYKLKKGLLSKADHLLPSTILWINIIADTVRVFVCMWQWVACMNVQMSRRMCKSLVLDTTTCVRVTQTNARSSSQQLSWGMFADKPQQPTLPPTPPPLPKEAGLWNTLYMVSLPGHSGKMLYMSTNMPLTHSLTTGPQKELIWVKAHWHTLAKTKFLFYGADTTEICICKR